MVSACKQIASSYPDFSKELGVVVFGNQAEQYASLFPFPIYPMNYVSNEKELVDIYNAVDFIRHTFFTRQPTQYHRRGNGLWYSRA